MNDVETFDEVTPGKISFKFNVDNSDIIRHTLFSLINVAQSKTSYDYAWTIIKKLLEELETEFDFLKYVQIDDIEKLENTIDDIIVANKFNNVDPVDIGRAIQNIVDIFKTRMGTKAGLFFLREFKDDLGDQYHAIIKKMGVDLRLIDLQKEVYGMSGEYKIKDDSSSNIGFITKNEEL